MKPHVSLFLCGIAIVLIFVAVGFFDSKKPVNGIEPAPIKIKSSENNCDFWVKENERLSKLMSDMQDQPYVVIYKNKKYYRVVELKDYIPPSNLPTVLPQKKAHSK